MLAKGMGFVKNSDIFSESINNCGTIWEKAGEGDQFMVKDALSKGVERERSNVLNDLLILSEGWDTPI